MRGSRLPPRRCVLLAVVTLLIAVKLFDEMIDLLRVALFVGYLS
jgi:hypothetical protein